MSLLSRQSSHKLAVDMAMVYFLNRVQFRCRLLLHCCSVMRWFHCHQQCVSRRIVLLSHCNSSHWHHQWCGLLLQARTTYICIILRRGYTRQLCCYNSATKLQATNRIVCQCHRRLCCTQPHFSVARNMLPGIDQLSIPPLCCHETSKACRLLHATTTHRAICCLQLLRATKLPSASPPLYLSHNLYSPSSPCPFWLICVLSVLALFSTAKSQFTCTVNCTLFITDNLMVYYGFSVSAVAVGRQNRRSSKID